MSIALFYFKKGAKIMSTQNTLATMSTSTKIKWLINILLTAAVFLIPTSDQFTMQIKIFLAITVFNILLMAFDNIPIIVPSLLLPLAYWIFKVADPSVIYHAWGDQIAWIVVGGLFFAYMMNISGLSKRIAYKCMILARGNFTLLMFIMIIPGIIIAPFVPAALARTALFCAIMMSLCDALGYKPDSKKAIIAFVVAYIVSANSGWLFMTGSNANIIATSYLQQNGIHVDFFSYMLYNFPPELLWIIGSVAIIILVNRDKNHQEDAANIRKHVKAQYSTLGKMTGKEKKMLVLMVLTFALLLTTNYHSLNAGMIFTLIVIIGFLPGMDLMTAKDISKINFSMVFMVTACVAIGDVSMELNAGQILMNALMPYAPQSLLALALFVFLIAFVGNLLMTPLALLAALSMPLISLSQGLGINPEAIIYIFLYSTASLILPYEITAGVVMYGYGMVNMKNFLKNFSIIAVWSLISIFIFLIPWFKITGLL